MPVPVCKGHKRQAKGPKLTTVVELQKFYARIMQMENTYGNGNVELNEHFKAMKEQFGQIPKLGLKRFKILWEALDPSVEELETIADILSNAAFR